MAVAKITCEIPGLMNFTGMTLSLFAYDAAQNAAAQVSGLALTVDTAQADLYWTTTSAGLTGLKKAIVLDGSTIRARGYVLMDDSTDIHPVVGDPATAHIVSASAVNLTGTTVGLTAAAIQGIWDALTASLTTVGSIGKYLVDTVTSGITAATIWSYSSRTLTQTAAAIASAIDGDEITIQRGDTVTISITGLGSLASRTGEKLWFTVKRHDTDADTAAVIQLGETTGLIRLNGAVTTASYATLVVTDQATGALTITLKPAMTSQLVDATLNYDIQILETAIVRTLSSGTVVVTADITRAIA